MRQLVSVLKNKKNKKTLTLQHTQNSLKKETIPKCKS